jgi:hypothetical protein
LNFPTSIAMSAYPRDGVGVSFVCGINAEKVRDLTRDGYAA